MHESEKWKWSCSVTSNPQRPHGLQPTRLLHPWDFPGRSTGVGCLHGPFLTLAKANPCALAYIIISQKKKKNRKHITRDFFGGPVAKAPRSQYRGLGLIPGQGTGSHMQQLRNLHRVCVCVCVCVCVYRLYVIKHIMELHTFNYQEVINFLLLNLLWQHQ